MTPAATPAGRIDRDGVHPGDDLESHATTIESEPDAPFAGLLARIARSGFLATNAGGRATWIVESGAPRWCRVGVVARQWRAPALVAPEEGSVARHFREAAPRPYFAYRRHAGPRLVLAALRESGPLPPRS